MSYVELLTGVFAVTGPIFILVLIGLGLKRSGFMDDQFVTQSSRLVFSLCLPVLLFTSITGQAEASSAGLLLLFCAGAALLTFVVSWLVALGVKPVADRGVFVQASFRSNLGVVGLALCDNAYGPQGLALASLLMAVLTISYNVLSVLVLAWYNPHKAISWRGVWWDIATNPLIIAIVLALLVNALAVPIPAVLATTGAYLGSLALPLALLGTGASLKLKALRHTTATTALGVTLKAALLPLLVTYLAWWLGFAGMELGVVFLLFVSPTATASFIMVKSMGGNDVLAANLIMASTLACLLTASLGLFALQLLQLN